MISSIEEATLEASVDVYSRQEEVFKICRNNWHCAKTAKGVL